MAVTPMTGIGGGGRIDAFALAMQRGPHPNPAGVVPSAILPGDWHGARLDDEDGVGIDLLHRENL